MRRISLEGGFGLRFNLLLVFEFFGTLKLAVALILATVVELILAMAVVLVIEVLILVVARDPRWAKPPPALA